MSYIDKIINKLLIKPLSIIQFNEILKNEDTFFNSIDLEKDLILENGLPLYFSNDNVHLKTMSTKIKDQVFCIVDIETNGNNAKDGQIIEIGAVKIKNNKILESYKSFASASFIPRKVQEITGITLDMLENAPNLKDVLEEFKIFLEDDVFVAHSIDFDYKFVSDSFKKYDIGELFNRKLCTINLARKTIKAERYGLKYLREELDINVGSHHRAYDDALSAMHVFNISLNNINNSIQYTEELIDFSTRNDTNGK